MRGAGVVARSARTCGAGWCAPSWTCRADRLSQQRGGELALLVTRGVSAVDPYLTRYLPALVVALVLPPLTLVAIGSQDLLSAAIVVVTLPLVPVFAALVGLATRDRAEQQWQSLGSLAGHFVDVVRGLPTLVVHRRARAQSATIRRVTDEHRRATLATLRLAFASSAVLELVATLSVALVAVTVGRAAGRPAPWTWVRRWWCCCWPPRRTGRCAGSARSSTPPPRAPPRSPRRRTCSTPSPHRRGRRRRGAGLDRAHPARPARRAYPGRRTPALDLPGRDRPAARGLVAVTGPSGCGKSTLLAVLAGELRPGRSPCTCRHRGGPSPGRLGAAAAVAGGPARSATCSWWPGPDATDADLWAALARVDLRRPGGRPARRPGRRRRRGRCQVLRRPARPAGAGPGGARAAAAGPRRRAVRAPRPRRRAGGGGHPDLARTDAPPSWSSRTRRRLVERPTGCSRLQPPPPARSPPRPGAPARRPPGALPCRTSRRARRRGRTPRGGVDGAGRAARRARLLPAASALTVDVRLADHPGRPSTRRCCS